MKTLLVSPYRDGSGWSQASIDFGLAMLGMQDIDLVTRYLKFNKVQAPYPAIFNQCESKSLEGIKQTIFFATPPNFFYDFRLGKNIGYTFIETNSVRKSGWVDYYNIMDEIWCPSEFIKSSLINSGVKVPVKIVHIPINERKYAKSYETPIEIQKDKDGDFLFYTIADFNHRKNLEGLIAAFYSEFDYNEPVNLVVKSSKYQISNNDHDIHQFVQKCQEKTKKRIVKRAIIIDDNYITNDKIYGIHQSCDVFVLASRGEGWCIPCIDALAFGKTPIVPNYGSFLEYMNNQNGWLVDCVEEPCYGMGDFPASIYNSDEIWSYPLQTSLRKCMREAYEHSNLRSVKSKAKVGCLQSLSQDIIQQEIRKALQNGQANPAITDQG